VRKPSRRHWPPYQPPPNKGKAGGCKPPGPTLAHNLTRQSKAMNMHTMTHDEAPVNPQHNVQAELVAAANKGRDARAEYRQGEIDGRSGEATVQLSKQARIAAVIKFGEALAVGRILNPSDKAFGQWVTDNGLDAPPFADRRERSDAMRIAELTVGSAPDSRFTACPVTTPSDIMKWARNNGLVKVAPKPAPKPAPQPVTPPPAAPAAQAPQPQPQAAAQPQPQAAAQPQPQAAAQPQPQAAPQAQAAPQPQPQPQKQTNKLDERSQKDINSEWAAREAAKYTAQVRATEPLKEKEKAKFERLLVRKLKEMAVAFQKERDDFKAKQGAENVRRIDAYLETHLKDERERCRVAFDEHNSSRLMYRDLIDNVKKPLNDAEFTLIRNTLHPDNHPSANADSKKRLGDAFGVFNTKKFYLIGKK
jgi:hypothetical protein